jgi:hypothetical protein
MPSWHALATTLATGHLLLVFCNAFRLPLPPANGPPARTLALYGTLSGANTGYGFFAPGVPPDRSVTFTMTDAQGRRWTDVLQLPHNREVNLQLHSVLAKIHQAPLRHAMAASWAGMMFGRHPAAVEVEVRVELCHMPTLDQYHSGQRPTWEIVYEATFGREDDGPAREED